MADWLEKNAEAVDDVLTQREQFGEVDGVT